jgi:hypothetical protein
MGETRNAYRILVGRYSRLWKVNIKMKLTVEETWFNGVYMAQDGAQWRDTVNMMMNILVP